MLKYSLKISKKQNWNKQLCQFEIRCFGDSSNRLVHSIYIYMYVHAGGGGEPEEVYKYIWPKCKNQKPLVYYIGVPIYVCKKVLVYVKLHTSTHIIIYIYPSDARVRIIHYYY